MSKNSCIHGKYKSRCKQCGGSSLCELQDCSVRASFNFEGQSPKFCAKHKKDGMICLTEYRKCNEYNCKKRPSFNLEGEKIRLYCSEHKKDGMVDISHRKCKELDCKNQCAFNFEGEKIATHCSKHKKDGMINIKTRRCNEIGCDKIPLFNFEGEKRRLYCVEHKKDGMIDIGHPKCKELGCKVRPSYNNENEDIGMYCVKHKKDGMIDVISKKCNDPFCEKQPAFNYETSKLPIYCSEHKKDGMVNVKNTKCKTHLCDKLISNPQYEGYCLRCFMYLFPDRPVSRNYKTKEAKVVEHVLERFPDFTWIHDKSIPDGCSKKRPDLLVDLGDQLIIIEVDENQHETYDCSCENKRLMELSQDVGHRPIIFIRFNPDQFQKEGKIIKSCWNSGVDGILRIPSNQIKNWEKRIEILLNTVQYWYENRTEKTIEVVELFYDEFCWE